MFLRGKLKRKIAFTLFIFYGPRKLKILVFPIDYCFFSWLKFGNWMRCEQGQQQSLPGPEGREGRKAPNPLHGLGVHSSIPCLGLVLLLAHKMLL